MMIDDFWELYDFTAKRRGLDSLRFTWAKSHPSWEMFLRGSINTSHAIPNGLADMAADLGLSAEGWAPLQQAIDDLCRKQTAYEKLNGRPQVSCYPYQSR